MAPSGRFGGLSSSPGGLLHCLRAFVARQTPSEAVLDASVGNLGAFWGRLRAVLGASWARLGSRLGPRGVILRRLWALLGGFLGRLKSNIGGHVSRL